MKRQTLQKTIILEALHRLCNHPTPAMVYEEVHKSYPSISQATVFRVLAGECDAGNAQRVYAPGCPARYESTGTSPAASAEGSPISKWLTPTPICAPGSLTQTGSPSRDFMWNFPDSAPNAGRKPKKIIIKSEINF